MSDTDDTDALLSCDPGGGLDKLLGATMEGYSEGQLDTSAETTKTGNDTKDEEEEEEDDDQNVNQNQTTDSTGSTSAASKRTRKKNAKKRKAAAAKKAAAEAEAARKKQLETQKTKDSTIETSDYFNSEGELVLSGLSQFSETSGADLDDSKEGEGRKSISVSGSGSSTAESNTVVEGVGDDSKKNKNNSGAKKSDNNDNSTSSSSEFERVPTSSVPLNIQDDLKRQILEANKNNPEVKKMLKGNTTKLAYGVLNLNLNDLKSFSQGLSQSNFFPKEEKVSTFVPTKNEKGEQIFTRAPNFRTPGGYVASPSPRKCRDLTEEQIREEVRKMYAFPFVEDGDEEGESSKQEKDIPQVSEESDAKAKGPVNFNFLDGTAVPNEFGTWKTGKPVKRKLQPQKLRGDNVTSCGENIGSVPNLGLGVRKEMHEELEPVEEPIVEQKTAFQTTNASPKENPEKKEENAKSRFSFGFGEEENMLSPIRPSVIQTAGSAPPSRFHPSPDKKVNNIENHSSSSTPTAVTTTSASSTSTSATTSETEQKQLNYCQDLILPPTEAILGVSVPISSAKISTPRRVILKAATKQREMAMPQSSPRSEKSPVPPAQFQPPTSVASDLFKF